MAGRKPKPRAIKKLEGNPGKRKLNTKEPIPAKGMHNLSNQQICGHVHDELIIECPENTTVNSITSFMGKSPDWMKDILIRGDGYDDIPQQDTW